jgi:hypothetical protein
MVHYSDFHASTTQWFVTTNCIHTRRASNRKETKQLFLPRDLMASIGEYHYKMSVRRGTCRDFAYSSHVNMCQPPGHKLEEPMTGRRRSNISYSMCYSMFLKFDP